MAISVTERALKKIAEFVAEDARPGVFFRVAVEGGGCKGFSYRMGLDTQVSGDDADVAPADAGPRVVVDGVSSTLLDGSQLDWVSSIAEEKFVLSNPNASSSCGCGTSFSI